MVFSHAFRKKILQKSANILLCIIFLQGSVAALLPLRVDAQAQLGDKVLEDPDFYEEISLITKAKLFIAGNEDPQETKKYDPIIGGFSLKVGSEDSLDDISVRIVKGDNSQTEVLKVEGADDYFGEKIDKDFEQRTSGLFIFPEGIKEIQFYYGGEVEFEIFTIEKDKKPEIAKIQPSEFYTTVENEKAYRKKLFSQMGLSIITRTEWGAPLTSTWGPTIADVNRIVVHHTATSVDMNDPSNTVRAIYNSHYYRCANNNGSYNPSDPNCDETSELWQDIGYNYLIDPQGRIYEGRAGGNGVIGAHAIPNSGSIGISILGNYSSQRPTTAAYNTLTRLISALSDLNGFDPVWQQSMYGHRNFMSTACPGQTLYNDLDDVTINARNMSTTTILSQTKSKTDALTENRDYLEQGGDTQVILDVTNTPADIKAKLLLPSRGVEEVTQEGNNLFYKVSEGLMDQVVAETLLVDPNTKAQPNFKYSIQSWTTTGSRSVPSDFDEGESDMHWNLERINMPEAWNELGGCASDASCGGDPSVVVAIVDTGVAHENYSFDAGTDASYTVEDFGGIYIEYPTNDTLDGTYQNGTSYQGYEREYTQSPELGNVNFVNPYDATQDFFCDLREGDLDATNDCNAAELAKINHANDDHGHGTFGATIIAGDTSDGAPNRIVGIAHNVSVMPIKAFYPNDTSMCQTSTGALDLTCADPNYDDRVVGNTFVISQGIQHAITNGADVINLSFRGIGTDPYMESVINQAAAAGIIVVAASGNDNIDITNVFPAGFDNVIAVGASDGDSNKAAYSNYGAKLDLVAPVGDTGLTLSSHTYSCYANTCSDETNQNLFSVFTSNEETPAPKKATGTSFAAPQVSAVAALLKAERASLNFAESLMIFRGSATDIASAGFDTGTGYGILNAQEAVNNVDQLRINYFTWYDTSNPDRKADIFMGNPNTTSGNLTSTTIRNTGIFGLNDIPASSVISNNFGNIKSGPVTLTSQYPLYATQRVTYENSFNEYPAISSTELDTSYYFTWYDTSRSNRLAWILIGNPSTTQTAIVNIKIGNVMDETHLVGPGATFTPSWPNIKNGPVKVTSNIPIYSSQRVSYEGFFNEYAGIPAGGLDTTYYFTWYDTSRADRLSWILVGNPSTTQTASVSIKIGSRAPRFYSIPPNGRVTPMYSNIKDGPVVVTSNIPVYATQRTQMAGAFNEYAGIPGNMLANKYYFPWYDTSRSTRQAWTIIANPSTTQTATVNLKIGNNINQNFSIPPQSRVIPIHQGLLTGPVVVSSDINVYTTQRNHYDGSFNEYAGIKEPQ